MAESAIPWRASPGRRTCAVCNTDSKNCSRTDNGLHFCRGEPAVPVNWKVVKGKPGSEFKSYRAADDRTNLRGERPDPPPQAPVNWVATAAEYVPRLTPAWKARGCAALGLPAGSLACLPLAGLNGFTGPVLHLTLPECDGDGRVVGLITRQPARDGGGTEKIAFSKAVRGLTLPAGWRERAGPVLVAEGASDTLAAWAARLCVVGRPFRDGGAGFLIRLLKDWPADRGIVVLADRDKEGQGRKGAEWVARALASALGRALKVADPPGAAKDVRDWLTAPERGATSWADRGRELLTHVEATAAEVRPENSPLPPLVPPPAAPGSPGRPPEIVIGTDEHRANEQAAAALAAEPDLFQMSGVLVALQPAADGASVLRPVHKDLIGHRLTRVARFTQPKSVGNGETVNLPCHPPPWMTRAVFVLGQWPGVRPVKALITYPAFLADGRVLATPGYDPASELLLADSPPVSLADRPSADDARRAAAELLDVVADFPLAGPHYRAAWLAALLTPLAWFGFDGPAPLFLSDANVAGTGKGKLLQVIGNVLAGHDFHAAGYTHDTVETRKLVTTLAIHGHPVVLLDNLTGAFGNAELDRALTAPKWEDRVLGGNSMYSGPLNLTWYATGNNVQVAGDMPRRICHLRMESAMERPEERDDMRHADLLGYVVANRPRLLTAALTILRAWHVAGRPTQKLPPWGSFDGWSAVVRQAVVWCGLADPGLARMSRADDGDPVAETMAAVLAGWRQLDPDGGGLTPGAMLKKLAQAEADEGLTEMKGALEELCGGKPDNSKVGYKLRAYKHRNFGGFMFQKCGVTHKVPRWRVMRVSATTLGISAPAAGTSGGGDGGDDGGFHHRFDLPVATPQETIPPIPSPQETIPPIPSPQETIPPIPSPRRKLTVVEELGYTLVSAVVPAPVLAEDLDFI